MFEPHASLDRRSTLGLLALLLGSPAAAQSALTGGGVENVRQHGARGDGKAIDSPAINRAIKAAAKRGGGVVLVPPGRYLSFSIRLVDNITLALSAGAVIEAADPDTHGRNYDPPENYMEEQFQDFGITHVHNSLIYADGASNIGVIGPGMLHGVGLDRDGPNDRWWKHENFQSAMALGISPRELVLRNPKEAAMVGRGNRAIGLRDCRNVQLRDFTILQGGHFGIIAHGCTNMAIDNVVIDTDRDGIDVDCCRDVRVTNCTVNAPKDDAIVLKSSYALGRPVICEDILVQGCKTSGYLMGSLLDGSYRKSDYNIEGGGVLGRIKMGTETVGGFRNVRISDCICTNSRGILVGIVDGGTMEDVVVSGITLRDPVNAPLFVHHGARMRAPRGTPVGKIRRVRFDDVQASGVDPRYPCGVEGIADGPVEDVTFRGVDVTSAGGGTAADVARDPEYRRETSLEVGYLKTLPAHGLWARHAKRLTVRDCSFAVEKADARPTIALRNVQGALIDGLMSSKPRDAAVSAKDSSGIAIGDVRVRA
ncbi:right-handed parallel beta-helix repeat-containing protein [Sphingomonas sp. MG17]|uniref:Right-handed parallel beta-helix repeat-containing protein n=1 Tax=Sphingomonas tagetis TaxID=2949092 RepID=A0A9X2HEP7_9SPHN|nr:right-handed parallel beta-helix repeat-containing protein [Sphingomonas tagetis]